MAAGRAELTGPDRGAPNNLPWLPIDLRRGARLVPLARQLLCAKPAWRGTVGTGAEGCQGDVEECARRDVAGTSMMNEAGITAPPEHQMI